MTRTLAIELPGIGEPDSLVARRLELPPPRAGQAVVPMKATGVSFAEQQMRRGEYYDQPPFPFVPGYDLVGVVEAVGPGVVSVAVGERVAAVTKTGAWAERVVVGRVLGLARDGAIQAPVAARFPLSEAADALRLAEGRGLVGKVIIEPDAAAPPTRRPR